MSDKKKSPQTRVFISYAFKDRDSINFIARLTPELEMYASTFTYKDLKAGDRQAQIVEAITTSHVFVVVMSEEQSKSELCTQERDEAFNQNKYIVPIKLHQDFVDRSFKGSACADFTNTFDFGMKSLIQLIMRLPSDNVETMLDPDMRENSNPLLYWLGNTQTAHVMDNLIQHDPFAKTRRDRRLGTRIFNNFIHSLFTKKEDSPVYQRTLPQQLAWTPSSSSPSVFINYALQDRKAIAILPELLSVVQVYMNVHTRKDIRELSISNAIGKCQVVIHLMSKAQVESEQCQTVIEEAKKQSKFVIPVQLDADFVDPAFANSNVIDLSSSSGFSRLIDVVRNAPLGGIIW